jgi:hypothetical protein
MIAGLSAGIPVGPTAVAALALAAIPSGGCTGAWASGAGAELVAGAPAYFFGMGAPAPARRNVSNQAGDRLDDVASRREL